MKNLLFLTFCFLSSFGFAQKTDTLKLDDFKIATLAKEVEETSGLTIFNNKLFTFNDSGGKPELYEINPCNGKLKNTYPIAEKNMDWEALTDDGVHFYIGEFGNNRGQRKDLSIIKVKFNPKEKTQKTEKFGFFIPEQTNFSDQNRNHDFDIESLTLDDGKLNIFTKEWVSRNVARYEITLNSKENTAAKKLESYPVDFIVTDASAHHGKFFLVGYNKQMQVFLAIFEKDANGNYFNNIYKKYFIGLSSYVGQIEGVVASDSGIYISGERFNMLGFDYPQTLFFIPYSKLF